MLGAAKTGEAFGAIMMSSLVKGLGRLTALLTRLRHGERTTGSLGHTRERMVAGDGGSCFLKLLTAGEERCRSSDQKKKRVSWDRVKTHAGTPSQGAKAWAGAVPGPSAGLALVPSSPVTLSLSACRESGADSLDGAGDLSVSGKR